jgi:hypothetical protein
LRIAFALFPAERGFGPHSTAVAAQLADIVKRASTVQVSSAPAASPGPGPGPGTTAVAAPVAKPVGKGFQHSSVPYIRSGRMSPYLTLGPAGLDSPDCHAGVARGPCRRVGSSACPRGPSASHWQRACITGIAGRHRRGDSNCGRGRRVDDSQTPTTGDESRWPAGASTSFWSWWPTYHFHAVSARRRCGRRKARTTTAPWFTRRCRDGRERRCGRGTRNGSSRITP